jgi:type VI protein secretion system component VasK
MILADFSLGDALLTVLWIFLLAIWFWLLIVIFADIFGRDMSGWAKAGWVVLIIIMPLLGILIYLIARPKPTDEEIAAAQAQQRAAAGVSNAEELEKLSALHDQGKLTDDEFNKEKAKILG